MQDNSIQDRDELSRSEPKIRRISEHRSSDLALMALCRPHRLAAILGWRLLGKRLRARGKLEQAVAGLPFAYERWNREKGKEDAALVDRVSASGTTPRFCVHLHIDNDSAPSDIEHALRSVERQSNPAICVVVTREAGARMALPEGRLIQPIDPACASRAEGVGLALKRARELSADWLVPLGASARLPQFAIAGYCAHLINGGEATRPAVLFGDEVEFAEGLKLRPKFWLKPQWDRRMILSQDYISRSCAISVKAALAQFDYDPNAHPASLFDLLLRIGATQHVEHVPRVTASTRQQVWRNNCPATLAAVKQHMGKAASEVSEGPYGTVAAKFELPNPLPKVSVIVATRDRVELLRTCMEGVLKETDYSNLEVIIADNESVEPETLRYMEEVSADPRVMVVRWPHPFNYSAINNFAAGHATGDYICLLNNDIEVLQPHWMSAMMREAAQPGVGAVGARLLYPDRSIQHAGVAIGIGNAAGHAHRGLPEGEPGYFAQALIARGASAVTAACLLVKREHFEAVGGLDEERLAVAYNDVDLCLKLRELGLANIYTPEATLIHHESKSRGLDFAPEHLERYMRELEVFQERWSAKCVVDPWHHAKLDRGKENYSIN